MTSLRHPCPMCARREQGASGFCDECEGRRQTERYLERELEERERRRERDVRLRKRSA